MNTYEVYIVEAWYDDFDYNEVVDTTEYVERTFSDENSAIDYIREFVEEAIHECRYDEFRGNEWTIPEVPSVDRIRSGEVCYWGDAKKCERYIGYRLVA